MTRKEFTKKLQHIVRQAVKGVPGLMAKFEPLFSPVTPPEEAALYRLIEMGQIEGLSLKSDDQSPEGLSALADQVPALLKPQAGLSQNIIHTLWRLSESQWAGLVSYLQVHDHTSTSILGQTIQETWTLLKSCQFSGLVSGELLDKWFLGLKKQSSQAAKHYQPMNAVHEEEVSKFKAKMAVNADRRAAFSLDLLVYSFIRYPLFYAALKRANFFTEDRAPFLQLAEINKRAEAEINKTAELEEEFLLQLLAATGELSWMSLNKKTTPLVTLILDWSRALIAALFSEPFSSKQSFQDIVEFYRIFLTLLNEEENFSLTEAWEELEDSYSNCRSDINVLAFNLSTHCYLGSERKTALSYSRANVFIDFVMAFTKKFDGLRRFSGLSLDETRTKVVERVNTKFNKEEAIVLSQTLATPSKSTKKRMPGMFASPPPSPISTKKKPMQTESKPSEGVRSVSRKLLFSEPASPGKPNDFFQPISRKLSFSEEEKAGKATQEEHRAPSPIRFNKGD